MKIIVVLCVLSCLGFSNGCKKCWGNWIRKMREKHKPKEKPTDASPPQPVQCPVTENCCKEVQRIASTVDQLIQRQEEMSAKLEKLISIAKAVQTSTTAVHKRSESVEQIIATSETEIITKIATFCKPTHIQQPPTPRYVPSAEMSEKKWRIIEPAE